LKSLFDYFFAFIGIIILFPFLLIIALLVLLSSKGPAIFTQKRVGKDGKLFTIYKFRTMCVNTDSNTISVKGDSRITKPGSFLRKYKLDELPEFFNILAGEMSFVGPRPDVPGYADKLEGNDRLILKLKPGITCEASLKYYNEEELLANAEDSIKYNDEIIFPDKVKINLDYYHNNSVWKDIKIIFKTIFH
jgi:lipopolysaccharide/colanic/teichoic acid biosynthesis glycosyltransferase